MSGGLSSRAPCKPNLDVFPNVTKYFTYNNTLYTDVADVAASVCECRVNDPDGLLQVTTAD